MTKANSAEIIVVLDRSGSMRIIQADMQGGFDSFMDEQRKVPGACRVSLYQFDNLYEPVYEARPIAEVPPLKLEPRGGTALLDAVGHAILATGHRFAAMPEADRPAAVTFAIITDGHENSSREFSRSQVRDLISEQARKYQWQFAYIGADSSTWEEAASLGIAPGATMSWSTADPEGTKRMSETFSSSNSAYRSGRASGQSVSLDFNDKKKGKS